MISSQNISMRKGMILLIISLCVIWLMPEIVQADGDETLGPPSIAIAQGTDIIIAGTGMVTQPGTIGLYVPVDADIQQVLLYWEGRSANENPQVDGTITVAEQSVTGTQIGIADVRQDSVAFRADITSLNVVTNGPNSIEVKDMDFNHRNNGASLVVIVDKGSPFADITLLDGDDFVYFDGPTPASLVSVPQTFYFSSAPYDRTATLSMIFGNAVPDRPDSVGITVGGVTDIISDEIVGAEGPELDIFYRMINIPAGVSEITVEVFSRNDGMGLTRDPDSLAWIFAALSIPSAIGGEGCTPGYWKQEQHFGAWEGYTPGTAFSDVFDDAFPGMTLLEVLEQGGGGIKALGRHTVAALLNANSPNTNYDLTAAEVISSFNEVYPGPKKDYNQKKNIFEAFNEQGCPLGRDEDDEGETGFISSSDSRSLSTVGSSSGGGGGCFISALLD